MTHLFTLQEYKSRLQKCQQLMKAKNLDLLILSQDTHVFYFTGYRTQLFFTRFRPFVCTIPANGDPALFVPFLEGVSAANESWVKEIRLWGANCEAENVVQLLGKYCEEKKLTKANVGLELDQGQRPGMVQNELEALKEKLSGCRFHNASDIMWTLRSVKSEQEVVYMKESCRISEKAFEVVSSCAKEGMTEREASAIVGKTMLEEGGDLQGILMVISGVDHYVLANPWPTDRAFKKGDMVIFDYGAVYHGYWTDLTRAFFIGSVSKRQEELYTAAFEIHKAAARVIRPGAEVGEIDKAAMARIKELGYEKLVRHRSGHAIGLEIHEMPSISSDVKTRLEPGMVFCIEPAIYDFSAGHFRIEDEIVVTETGFEYLSKSREGLIVR